MHVKTAGAHLVFAPQNPRCELRARFVQVLSMDKRGFATSCENEPSTSGFANAKNLSGFVRLSSGSESRTLLCDYPGAPEVAPGRFFDALWGLVYLQATGNGGSRMSREQMVGRCFTCSLLRSVAFYGL